MSRTKHQMLRVGKTIDGAKPVEIDLATFIRTRALIESNSGGGKSYLIRRLAEVLFDHIPIIIFDLEGEFLTLREKYPFLIGGIGDGYDFVTDPASAAVLARKILELKASVILDISEVQVSKRAPFVKIFLESLVNAKKELWTPYVVIIDEAHHFAPQASKKESESLAAVIDLCTRGRKRGLCAVLATQRISKINKDATAELNNKLIGRTSQDIDMKRASDELGFRTDDDEKSLRELEPGEFYVFGPAVSRAVKKIMIDKVVTHHPEVGETTALIKPVAPTPKIKSMLQKLSDVPVQAKQELHDLESLRQELRKRDAELRQVKAQQGKPQVVAKPVVDKAALVDKYNAGVNHGWSEAYREFSRQVGAELSAVGKRINDDLRKKTPTLTAALVSAPVVRRETPTIAEIKRATPQISESGEEIVLPAGPRKILTYLAQYFPNRLTRGQTGGYTGYSMTGGTFQNYLSLLKKFEFVSETGEGLASTELGREYLGDIPPAPDTAEEVITMWLGKLPAGPRKIFNTVVGEWRDGGAGYSREEIGSLTGFTATGGTFSNYLSLLRRNKLIVESNGLVKLNEEILPQ